MLLIRNKPLRVFFGTLETFSLLTLKLWWKNRVRARSFPGKVFRDYMSLVGRDRWTSLGLHEIFPDMAGMRIVLEHLRGEGIYTPVEELAYMALITQHLQPKRIFEIGTFRGRTALNFALNSPPDCTIYTLDLPPEEREQFRQQTNPADAALIRASRTGVDYQGKDCAHKIRQLFGDSTRFDFSPYAGQMDLVFVDGAHHFEAVASDTRNALQMAKPGGWILWDDFAQYGDYNDVTRAVLEQLSGRRVLQIDNTNLALYQTDRP